MFVSAQSTTGPIDSTGLLAPPKWNTSWTPILVMCYGATLIRTILEYYIYKVPPINFTNTFVHFPISFICFAMCIAGVISLLTRYPIDRGCRLALLLIPVIILPPAIDAWVYGIKVRTIAYLWPDANPLLQFLQAVFTRRFATHISVGQLVVVHGIALAAGVFGWFRTRRIITALLCWLAILVVIFFWAVFPMAIRQIAAEIHKPLWQALMPNALLPENLTEDGSLFGSADNVSTAVYLLALPVVLGMMVYLHDRQLLAALLGNVRAMRLCHYLLMLVLGMLIAVKRTGSATLLLGHPMNLLAILICGEAIAAAFVGSVWINDVYDHAIDLQTNPKRPLAAGLVSPAAALAIGIGHCVLASLCGALLGAHVLIVLAVALTLSIAYSVPPYRLRRYFPASVLVLGIISMLTVQAGYTFAGAGSVTFLPGRLAAGVTLGITLLAMFKDIKDAAGDRLDGVTTLVTMLSGRLGRLVTGTAVLLGAVVLASAVFRGTTAAVLGIPAGLVGMGVTIFATKWESWLLILYFASMSTAICLYAAG